MNKGRVHAMDFRTEHQRAIDAFIPEALAFARKKVKNLKNKTKIIFFMGKDCKHSFEAQYFHQEMTRLTIAAGLRCQ